jgi:tRNA A37 threonylcarbamoyladenosine biosynthesis protein TsaE
MRINSPEAMISFGREMANKANHILLYGELGAGKTQFVKGFVE